MDKPRLQRLPYFLRLMTMFAMQVLTLVAFIGMGNASYPESAKLMAIGFLVIAQLILQLSYFIQRCRDIAPNNTPVACIIIFLISCFLPPVGLLILLLVPSNFRTEYVVRVTNVDEIAEQVKVKLQTEGEAK